MGKLVEENVRKNHRDGLAISNVGEKIKWYYK
jgi:hypothetical protein